MKKKEKKGPGELIEELYLEHGPEDDDEMFWLKEALKNALNPLERKIYLTYVENETYTATAELFKVSMPTVSRYIKTLQNKITDYVSNHM